MYNLMKIFCPAGLIWHMCFLRPASLIWRLCHSLLNNTPFDISSDIDSDDEHPPPPISPPAPTPPTTSQLPRWVRSFCEAASDLAGDPRD